jgi:hypothetical protein
MSLRVLVAIAAAVTGVLLTQLLPNDGCNDICDTPAWRAFVASSAAAAASRSRSSRTPTPRPRGA